MKYIIKNRFFYLSDFAILTSHKSILHFHKEKEKTIEISSLINASNIDIVDTF